MMGNAAAAAVSMRHGLRGPAFGTMSACSSGADAIGTAMRAIVAGDAVAVVTGGAEAALTPLSHAAFGALDALSVTGISRPFDARRDGFVMGEGAGVLVLENGDAARARGARILAVMRGYGATADAHHVTAPDPVRERRRAGDRRARSTDAGLDAGGRRLRQRPRHLDAAQRPRRDDRAEGRASASARARSRCPRRSRRSATCSAPPGAVEAVATILALRARLIPPTLGLEQPDPELDLDYVPGARPCARARRRRAGRSRSPTRSASAATTPCSVWRQHDARPRSATR